ncbi:MAG: ferric reductase-like transmembrane domain-containing protein [Candidatus Nanohalobium sp.]
MATLSEVRKGKGLIISGYLLSFIIGALLTINSSFGITSYSLGKVLGVWSLTALTFQALLVSRAKIIEKAVGYDRITRWHAGNAALILLLVVLHPVLIFYQQIISINPGAVIEFLAINPSALLGATAVGLILIQGAVTLYWKGLSYEKWRILHKIGYLIVILGFAHSLLLGSDIGLPPQTLVSFWWLGLAAVASISAGYRYLYLPGNRKEYTVREVDKEAEDVHTVKLKPEDEVIEQEPGQFAFTRFESENLETEEHPFTIASAPEKGLKFTVKESGDYTSGIGELEPGDKAVVEGPYGRFTMPRSKKLVMVAGGIGITPFISMLRYMARNPEEVRETHLIYGNSTEASIAFREELEELEKNSDWLEATHMLSREEKEGFRYGRIDGELLEDVTGLEGDFMVCGPEEMIEDVRKDLIGLDVDSSRIKSEKFSLRELDLGGLI